MGYQQSPKTITVTQTGELVDIRPDYTTKTVAVFIGGEYRGTFKCQTAARQALGLIEVPAKGRK